MEFSAFKFRIENNIAHVTLSQGKRGNPFDAAYCSEIKDIANECDTNRDVRAVLIDAEGPYFSVGGDLKTFVDSGPEGLPKFIKNATGNIHMAAARLAKMDAPVIVQADALVAGGGVALAAAADFLLAGPNAKFYAAFAGIGFSCDCGTSHFLPRRVGARRAFSFLARNEMWSAEQALEYGLVSEIHSSETLRDAALKLATELAAGPTVAYGKLKNLMLDTFNTPIEAQLEKEARALAECSASEDAWNAIQAVAGKQKAVFNNK